jgi:hypothetical protein
VIVDVNVFAILIAVILAAAVGGIALLFTNTDLGFELFKYLYAASMIFSVIALLNLGFQLVWGQMATSSDWIWAISSGLVAVLCIYYGLWGFTEGRQHSLEEKKERPLQRDRMM